MTDMCYCGHDELEHDCDESAELEGGHIPTHCLVCPRSGDCKGFLLLEDTIYPEAA